MISLTKTRAALALAAILLGMAAGCNDPQYDMTCQADAEWELGADRPPTEATMRTMARMLEAQGHHAQAEFILHKVVREHPKHLPTYVDLAELYTRLRRFDDAEQALLKGLQVAPQDAVMLNDLGMVYMIQREYERAAMMFERAAAAAPQDARYRSNLAAAIGMQGRYDEAFALYEQILPAKEAHHNIAILCEARDDKARAEQERVCIENLNMLLPNKPTAAGNTPPPMSRTALASP